MTQSSKSSKTVATLTHAEARRRNIPTAEYESVMDDEQKSPIQVAYERRNRDLDPQLVWRGKDEQDWSDLVVPAPPLYIQEKVHPKVLIDDLLRQSQQRSDAEQPQMSLFADFNGLPSTAAATEFYQHEANWTNRLILGDSLQVMASLAEREGLRGKVQCIYIDPPYGIKFNSNFQWSTTSRDVKDGNKDHITREPEQVKAFRDTWRDGVHSYLTYLRDRLTVARDLLSNSGSIFAQIGDENVHRVRALMDEVFGEDNFISLIAFLKTSSSTTNELASTSDYIIWYAREKARIKFRAPTVSKTLKGAGGGEYRSIMLPTGATRRLSDEELSSPDPLPADWRIFRLDTVTSQSPGSKYDVEIAGRKFFPSGYWKTEQPSMNRLIKAGRIVPRANSLGYLRFFDDYGAVVLSNTWTDTQIAGRPGDKIYVVQTLPKVIQRCILMATDPGDLVLDPTCGSGTTAFVAEQLAASPERPYDFVVIDESQDLSVAELRLAAVLGYQHPDSLFFAGDLGQRIFQQPFSWKSVGVDIRGRSHTLTINYRTSHQIRQQADQLLPIAVADVDGNVEERRGTISVFNGQPPAIVVCEDLETEAQTVSQWLTERLGEGLRPEEIGVFVRAEAQLPRAQEAVELGGAEPARLDDKVAPARGCIAISTMHLAKGLEFRAVAVMACDDEVIPLQSRIETVSDESDLEEVYTTERHLLYVACTRARDHLLVTGVDPASEFLDDLAS